MDELRGQVCAEKECMINLRRDFHRHPELSLQERHTAGVIEQELEWFEISHARTGATDVLRILRGAQSGSGVVALRADIDVLPIQETNDVEYCSQTGGIIHTCGRNAHTTSLLGAAKVLSQDHDRFGGGLCFLFQPAEETSKDAPDFMDAGTLGDTERILGLHSTPDLPLDTIGLTPELNNVAVDHLRILVHDKAAHVSAPQLGVDALHTASQIVVAIQGLVARRSSSVEPVLLDVGKFAIEATYNAVAECTELGGTTRTISQETRLQVRERIDQTAEQIAAISGVEARVIWSGITSALINDPQVSHEAAEMAKGLGDHIQVVTNHPLSLGGDNFIKCQRLIPGYYAYVGTANTDLPSTLDSLHSGNFDSDENALVLGADLYVGCALW